MHISEARYDYPFGKHHCIRKEIVERALLFAELRMQRYTASIVAGMGSAAQWGMDHKFGILADMHMNASANNGEGYMRFDQIYANMAKPSPKEWHFFGTKETKQRMTQGISAVINFACLGVLMGNAMANSFNYVSGASYYVQHFLTSIAAPTVLTLECLTDRRNCTLDAEGRGGGPYKRSVATRETKWKSIK